MFQISASPTQNNKNASRKKPVCEAFERSTYFGLELLTANNSR